MTADGCNDSARWQSGCCDVASPLYGDVQISDVVQHEVDKSLDVVIADKLFEALHCDRRIAAGVGECVVPCGHNFVVELAHLLRQRLPVLVSIQAVLRKEVVPLVQHIVAELLLLLGEVGTSNNADDRLCRLVQKPVSTPFAQHIYSTHLGAQFLEECAHLRLDLQASWRQSSVDIEEENALGVRASFHGVGVTVHCFYCFAFL